MNWLRSTRHVWVVIVLLLLIGLLALGWYVVFGPSRDTGFSNIVNCDQIWPDGHDGFVMGPCPGSPMYASFATQYGPYVDATQTAQSR